MSEPRWVPGGTATGSESKQPLSERTKDTHPHDTYLHEQIAALEAKVVELRTARDRYYKDVLRLEADLLGTSD